MIHCPDCLQGRLVEDRFSSAAQAECDWCGQWYEFRLIPLVEPQLD